MCTEYQIVRTNLKYIIFGSIFSFLLTHTAMGQTEHFTAYTKIAERSFDRRVAAEWEKREYLVLVWKNYPEVLSEIAHYAQDEGQVLILCRDSQEVKKYFRLHFYQTRKIKFLNFDFNSPWVRDYSPANLYQEGSSDFMLVDWLYNRRRKDDDLFPMQLAQFIQRPIMQLSIADSGVVQIGGNLMTNGLCSAFSSNLLLKENARLTEDSLKFYFQHFLGIKNYVLLDTLPYDIIHHIDMHLKLINPSTILVGKFPDGVSDQPYISRNIQKIKKHYKTCFDTDYRFVEIPMPDDFGRYPDSSGWADYLTYTNSLIFNKTVFVPVYGNSSDDFALAIYQKNFPAYRIIGINVDNPIMDGGAVHCLTYSVPADTAFIIWHENQKYFSASQKNLSFYATVFYPKQIQRLQLFYRFDKKNSFRQLFMKQDDSLGVFSCTLNFPKHEKLLNYYILAQAVDGRTETLPMTAPEGFFTVQHHNKQRLVLSLPKDTPEVKKRILPLRAQFSGMDADELLFYWKSLDGLNMKNANKVNAKVFFPIKSAKKVYSFVLMVSDGEKLYSDTLRVTLEK